MKDILIRSAQGDCFDDDLTILPHFILGDECLQVDAHHQCYVVSSQMRRK